MAKKGPKKGKIGRKGLSDFKEGPYKPGKVPSKKTVRDNTNPVIDTQPPPSEGPKK